jgi:hypothetical protein
MVFYRAKYNGKQTIQLFMYVQIQVTQPSLRLQSIVPKLSAPLFHGSTFFNSQEIMQHLQHPDPPSRSSVTFFASRLLPRFSVIVANCCCCCSAAFLASTTRRTIRLNVSSTFTFNFALVSINPIPLVLAHERPSADEIAR